MRIVFMGTPHFAVPALEGLLDGGYQVAAVYTGPDKPGGRGQQLSISAVKEVALARKLSIYQPASLRTPAEIETIGTLVPDLIVVAAYGLILPRTVLQLPRYGCLNIHPSLLPRHRGPSPVSAAILAGDRRTGVTIMLMDEGTDTGPIVAQQEEMILPDDDSGSLTARLAKSGAGLLLKVIPRWVGGEIKPASQDDSRATFSRTLRKEDGDIDWTRPAEEIERRVRAFHPWPGCFTFWKGKRLKIVKATTGEAAMEGVPGQVVPLSRRGQVAPGVITGKGILVLERLQLEGKREMAGEEFIPGQRDFPGGILVAGMTKVIK